MTAAVPDKKRLVKAIRDAGLSPLQVRMAAILMAVNGIESALEFVRGLGAQPGDLLEYVPETVAK